MHAWISSTEGMSHCSCCDIQQLIFYSLSQWTLKKKLNFIFLTKYVIPKNWKFSHWPSKFNILGPGMSDVNQLFSTRLWLVTIYSICATSQYENIFNLRKKCFVFQIWEYWRICYQDQDLVGFAKKKVWNKPAKPTLQGTNIPFGRLPPTQDVKSPPGFLHFLSSGIPGLGLNLHLPLACWG